MVQAADSAFDVLNKISAYVPGFIYEYRQEPDGAVSFPWSSQGIIDIYGVTPEEASEDATICFARIHEDDLPGVIDCIEVSEKSMTKWDQVFRIRHPKKGIIWAHGQSNPERASDGAMLWYGCLLDITATKEADLELQKRERRLTAVLETIEEGVLVVSAEGLIETANPAACAMMDLTEDELRGQAITQHLQSHWDLGDLPSAMIHAFNMTRNQEAELVLTDQSRIPVSVVVGRFEIQGRPRYLVTMSDQREAKKAQAQLIHLQKMEAMGQLTGGVAHDFNNILAVLHLNMELLLDGDCSEQDRGLVNQSLSVVRRGKTLTEHLLSFARRSKLLPQVINSYEVVEGARSLAAKLVGDTIHLRTDHRASFNVKADPGLLENAILNLCINARDAMPSGGELILSSFDVDDETILEDGKMADNMVGIRVQDTGTGMPEDVRRRVFEPFFSTKGEGRGNGLGLSMVHGFVTQSGGAITIDSVEGRGTSVTLYLPRVKAQDGHSRSVEKPQVPMGRGERILLVEDDLSLKQSISQILDGLGYRVEGASDGRTALRALSDGDFDFIISDYRMPGEMNGLDVLTHKSASGLPRLLISAYTENMKTQDVHNVGISFLAKPFSRWALAHEIRTLLNASGCKGV